MNFFDYITAKAQSIYWNEIAATQSEPPYLGEELFPNKKQDGLRLDWIKGANQRAVELHLSAFDSKVLKRNRIGFAEMSAKMPFFKDSFDIDEELRQKLLQFSQSQVAYAQEIIRRIFDDNMTLIKSASVTREAMRMQLLTTGTIAIANNGQEYLYDYNLDDDQKQTVKTAWTNPEADVLGDIINYQDMMVNKTGVKPTRLVMRTSVFRALMKNEYIKNYLYVLSNGRVNATETAVKDFFREQAGITSIALYDKVYTDTEGKQKNFLPDDVVIMLPEGTLGSTVFGTTPEEADLLGTKQADVSIVDTGVAITVTRETDPVRVVTKVSEICLPSGENMDKIVIVDIKGE
jgi:hypothetical protein